MFPHLSRLKTRWAFGTSMILWDRVRHSGKRNITGALGYPGVTLKGVVMPKVLTVQSVARFTPDPAKRLEIADGLLTGLYHVIQPSGVRSWAVRYRHGGKPRKLTLGPYPALDLGTARANAREALQAVALGRDPAREKQNAKRTA